MDMKGSVKGMNYKLGQWKAWKTKKGNGMGKK